MLLLGDLDDELLRQLLEFQKDFPKAFLPNGEVNLNCSNDKNQNLLSYAIENGYYDLAHCFIDQGAYVNCKDFGRNTPLHYAIRSDNRGLIGHLVQNGADVNLKDLYGNTPLHIAAENQIPEQVEFLLSSGADVTLMNSEGFTPLHASIINSTGKDGEISPVSRAINDMLLSKCSWLQDMQAKGGFTALHIAAIYKKDISIINYLLSKGADPGIKDHSFDRIVDERLENDTFEQADYEPLGRGAFFTDYLSDEVFSGLVQLLPENIRVTRPRNISEFSKIIRILEEDFENRFAGMGYEDWKKLGEQHCKNYIETAINNEEELARAYSLGYDIRGMYNHMRTEKESSFLNAVYAGKLDTFIDFEGIRFEDYMFAVEQAINNNDLMSLRELLNGAGVSTLDTPEFRKIFSRVGRNGNTKMLEVLSPIVELGERMTEDGNESFVIDLSSLSPDNGQETGQEASEVLLNSIETGDLQKVRELVSQDVGVTYVMPINALKKLFEEEVNERNRDFNKILIFKEMIRILINATHDDGKTMLMGMIDLNMSNKEELFNLFLKNGAAVNISDLNLNTPLLMAIKNNSPEIVMLFINNGADINKAGMGGRTPLFEAFERGNYLIINILLQMGAKTDILNSKGETFLEAILMSTGTNFLFDILPDPRVNINFSNRAGDTLLHLAVNKEELHIVRTILARFDLDPNKINRAGDTPLHLAVKSNYDHIVRELLKERGRINVDLKNRKGDTPLHLAVKSGNADIVELLLKANADINLKDANHKLPLEIAEENQSNVIIGMLKSKMDEIRNRRNFSTNGLELTLPAELPRTPSGEDGDMSHQPGSKEATPQNPESPQPSRREPPKDPSSGFRYW